MGIVAESNRNPAIESLRLELRDCQRELAVSRRRLEELESLFANVADAIFVAELDGRLVDVNQAACTTLGYSKFELLSLHLWDLVATESREEVLGLVRGMLPNAPVTVRGTCQTKSGQHPIVDLNLVRCSLGGRDRIVVTSRDVTVQQQAIEAQRRAEAFLTEAQRLSLTGSFGWNVATGEVHWSAETFCILGYEPSTKPTLDLVLRRVSPDDLDTVRQALDRAQRDIGDLDFEYRLMMPDGQIKHVHLMARATRTPAGVVEFVGALMDVTQRTQAARALRVSEHLARGQLETLTESLTVLSRESKPEKFLEHVLGMICGHLGAHSIGVWELNDVTGNMELTANFEDDRLHLPTPEQMRVDSQVHFAQSECRVWAEFFRGEIACAYGKIDSGPPWVRVAMDPGGPWYDSSRSFAAHELVAKITEHFFALGIVAVIYIPMLVAGKVTGLFSIQSKQMRRPRQEEIVLTQAMAHQATLAIRLMRLSQQSREAAVTAERVRMARDIHDTLAQGFTGVIVQLEAAKGAIAKQNYDDASRRMDCASELSRSSLQEARRSMLALRPYSLQSGPLGSALDGLLKRMTDGLPLRAIFEVTGQERVIPPESEENLLRIMQEALTNTIKHARAHTFRVTLSYAAEEVLLRIIDDGQGFDLEIEHEGFGLIGMKERVDRMNGRFMINSAPDKGTEISIYVPNPPAVKRI
jgi:PAS domain S-box-containing protein